MKRSTGLKPMSDRRREKLAAEGVMFPSSTLIAKTSSTAKRSSKRPRNTGPDSATVDVVLERDSYSCTVCGDGLHGPRGEAWSIHHRLRRSQGLDNRPSNLIAVCGGARADGCHQSIHGAPAKAREAGWLLRSTDDPTQMEMAHSQHGWVFLADSGGIQGRRDAA